MEANHYGFSHPPFWLMCEKYKEMEGVQRQQPLFVAHQATQNLSIQVKFLSVCGTRQKKNLS